MERLIEEIVIVLDCEYSTMGMPGTGRPNTFRDEIELCQIGAVKVQFPSGTVLGEFDEIFAGILKFGRY